MSGLVKAAILAAPALVLVIYLWGGKSAQYEAQMAVDSAEIDRSFARVNESVEKDPKLKAEWAAEKTVAQQRYSTSQVEAIKIKNKSDKDVEDLQQAVKDWEKDNK